MLCAKCVLSLADIFADRVVAVSCSLAGSVAEARASARASLASDSAPEPSPRPGRGHMPPLGKGPRAGAGLKASSFVGWDPKGGPLVAGGADGRRERARRAHSGHVL